MSIFSSWLASPPPDAAVEIAPERISAATLASRGSQSIITSYASQPLPTGAVIASLTSPNILDRRLVVESLREVIGQLNTRPKKVALVIPDAAAKVSLLHFDTTPSRRDDMDQLVRWQVRKSAPFAIEDASVTYTPGTRTATGREFIVELARHDIVRDYETVCGNAGVYAGLVDTATMSLLNLFLASDRPPGGDWLLVHMRPGYTSLAIVRGSELIFFRNRPEGEGDSLTDMVHQTAMYYQDRLSGQGFSRVLLGGRGEAPGDEDTARRSLQERLGVNVDAIDTSVSASIADRANAPADVLDMLAPLAGILLRTQREAVTA
jgi:type IV pilus assembly protein PilM